MKNLTKLYVCFTFLLLIIFSWAAYGQTKIQREVAVTVDDLPASHGNLEQMTYVTVRMSKGFKKHDVPAIGFVNERKLYRVGEMDARVGLLQMWLDAGFELGNHTFSHVFLDRASIERVAVRITPRTLTRRRKEKKLSPEGSEKCDVCFPRPIERSTAGAAPEVFTPKRCIEHFL